MREIPSSAITETVARLCEQANLRLPCGMRECITASAEKEESPLCRSVLGDIVSNIDCAAELGVPICQDTGMAVIFAEIGQDVHITGEAFEDAVNAGVAQGYVNGKLRLSIVGDPLERKNTNNNTPAVIHTRIVPGDKIHIMAAPLPKTACSRRPIKTRRNTVSARRPRSAATGAQTRTQGSHPTQ